MTAEMKGCATLLFPIVCIGVPFWLAWRMAEWCGLAVEWQAVFGLAGAVLAVIAANVVAARQRRGR